MLPTDSVIDLGFPDRPVPASPIVRGDKAFDASGVPEGATAVDVPAIVLRQRRGAASPPATAISWIACAGVWLQDAQ